MKVSLISHTPDPLSIFAQSARITRSKGEDWKSDLYYFKLLYQSGHHSVFEHAMFSFLIEDISRACSHQLVRFRIGTSFTQRSQRYTEESDFSYTCPPSIAKNADALKSYSALVDQARASYEDLVSKGIPKEDARFVLPNATHTSLVMSMNYRELIHACSLRLCTKSQWEIQELFWRVRKIMEKVDPVLVSILYPRCFHDRYCKEAHPCRLEKYFLDKYTSWRASL